MSRSKQLKRDRSRLSPLQGIKTGDYPLRGTSAGNESFLSYLLYAFEINVRASTILGYIGAGGIGVFLQRSLSQFRYDQTAIIVLAIFIVVLLIDTISNRVRERLL